VKIGDRVHAFFDEVVHPQSGVTLRIPNWERRAS